MANKPGLPEGMTITYNTDGRKKGVIRRFFDFLFTAVITFFVLAVIALAFASSPLGPPFLDAVIAAMS